MQARRSNAAEGSHFRDGNRRKAYSIAIGEADETKLHIDNGVAAGYLADDDPRVLAALDRASKVAATLTNCLRYRP